MAYVLSADIRKLDDLGCVIGVFDVNELPQAIDNAKSFDFKKIEKGNAENIIKQKLSEWFG